MKILTKEQIKQLKSITAFGKFIHRQSDKLFVSKTDFLLRLEFEHKKLLYDISKEVKIECFELLENGKIGNSKLLIPLADLRIIISLEQEGFDDIYIEQ